MSVQLGKVVSLILLQRFGPVVEKVGSYLFESKSSPLLYIKRTTQLPLSKVKESLCILIKFGLVTYTPNKNQNIANYSLEVKNILLMLRYPKYIHLIKRLYGDEAEMLIEELLQRGYWTASELILQVHQRLLKNDHQISLSSIKDKFVYLVTAKYLKRINYNVDDSKPVPSLVMNLEEMYSIPTIDVKLLASASLGHGVGYPDSKIYWTINFDRFHEDMRDKLIVSSFSRKFDENAGKLMKLLLVQMYIRTEPWADMSNPTPIVEIKDILKKQRDLTQLNAFFDHYVSVLEQDSSKILRKTGEAGGGSFQLYMKEAFTQFAWELVEQVVLEKFDTKAARIFRLVKLKPYIEPDQIQQFAMIPAKEAKSLSYQLYEENFLHIQELKKASANNGPTKNFTLFHIQLDSIVHMILELCYKSLYNIMTRRTHENQTNKRIIDKKQRVDAIAMGMRSQGATEEQLADIEEMVTPAEKDILERIDKNIRKLNIAELEIDDTMFMLQMYLAYQ